METAISFLVYPAVTPQYTESTLRGVEWVHGLFLFPFVLGKM